MFCLLLRQYQEAVAALVLFGVLSVENKMLCQNLFSVTAGILAMLHGSDSHFVASL